MGYTAVHRHAPIAPRKAQLLAQLVRGKNVNEALDTLRFAPQRAARMIEKVIRSAQANAQDLGVSDPDALFVSRAVVDQAPVLKRWRPAARGMAKPRLRRRSHISVELESNES